jgi:hypothetical protein
MELVLIYHFRSSQNQDAEFHPARYRVVHFFSEQGFLEQKLLKELSKSVPDADHQELTFLSLDDLKIFALRVAQEFQKPEVRLISIQDYNIGLDGARDLASFRSIFEQFGELAINEEVSKKKSFFGKLFS